MTNVHAFMVTRNESGRYLQACLEWNSQWWDTFFVYDDRSTDDTFEIALSYADAAGQRHEDNPSFMDHEGQFRNNAWKMFKEAIEPSEDDWVFAIDADEFLAPSAKELTAHKEVRTLVQAAEDVGRSSVLIPIPEVWDVTGMPLKIRTDNSWKGNKGPRLFKFSPEGGFNTRKKMACGTHPDYAASNPMNVLHMVTLLHFGYALPEDRERKYERYLGRTGHGKKHIESIRSRNPTLEEWKGVTPKWLL